MKKQQKEEINSIRNRITDGESFSELARGAF
jgi:hypothetical protein